jgi:hypothetical protein
MKLPFLSRYPARASSDKTEFRCRLVDGVKECGGGEDGVVGLKKLATQYQGGLTKGGRLGG